MSPSANTDCYLCGAPNEPEASHCARCNGQILRIPSADPVDVAEDTAPVEELRAELLPEEPEAKTPKRRISRKGNIADQRLSDALGLDKTVEIDDGDDGLVDTVVTSIPRATPAADIPLLGTRAGAVPQSAMRDREAGKLTYVLLALLALVTGWLAYDTVLTEPEGPPSIAFTGTTTTSSTSTTTTEPQRRTWQVGDVNAKYSQVFASITLFNCSNPASPDELAEVFGVALDDHNVLIDGSGFGGSADVAQVASRAGTGTRIAILETSAAGARIATARTAWSRNIGIDELPADPGVDESFFVGFDPVSKAVTIDTTRQDLAVEISVSETGDPVTVYMADAAYSVADLVEIDTRVEDEPAATVPSNPTSCQIAASWSDASTAGTDVGGTATDDFGNGE